VIALPSSLPGASNAMLSDATPLVTESRVGASGGPAGTTTLDVADGRLVPTPLVAVRVHA
jgi:hypothetical protein